MAERVWKYVLPGPDERGRSVVAMPAIIEPLSIGIQDGELVVWALVDPDLQPPDSGLVSRLFIVANTGAQLPSFPRYSRFLGTATSANGIVWHVWDGGEQSA